MRLKTYALRQAKKDLIKYENIASSLIAPVLGHICICWNTENVQPYSLDIIPLYGADMERQQILGMKSNRRHIVFLAFTYN